MLISPYACIFCYADIPNFVAFSTLYKNSTLWFLLKAGEPSYPLIFPDCSNLLKMWCHFELTYIFTLIIYDIIDGLKNVYFNTVERKKERKRIDNWDKNFKMKDGKI